ncbi:exported hypothetical protein [Candidatus Accumulibacter aalborgensis]|uniref:Uncharacterized protein n=1 Tax=Candidatus Accumulibacter aalborgensis TaxID=1860102 RepID=A0A1A8XI97_9PROT|nr:hypothetical protein [Candidatus Accumulibacter aalborgensis]SBT04416.1 exported hypothetical protein [Candidatus Accumulibacter aalborgensis]
MVATGLALALCTSAAQAHLVETALGPLYDVIVHFALTPEDLIPALALALLTGLRGRALARRRIFVLPGPWLLGGVVGVFIGTPAFAVPAWLPLLMLGGLVAADARLPDGTTSAIAALLGHGAGRPGTRRGHRQRLRGCRRHDAGLRVCGCVASKVDANRLAHCRRLDRGERVAAAWLVTETVS